MIVVYTGKGKGKTSASVGQALRAHGQGLKVAFAQFMKRPEQAGEQAMLCALLGESFFVGGRGFFKNEAQRDEHRRAALAVLDWAQRALPQADLLVLDECLYALGAGLLTDDEVKELVAAARAKSTHLVLSGRGLPEWLVAEADIITEMQPVKHVFETGQGAVKGIEF